MSQTWCGSGPHDYEAEPPFSAVFYDHSCAPDHLPPHPLLIPSLRFKWVGQKAIHVAERYLNVTDY